MSYNFEKYRAKREKVLGVRKRGMSFALAASLVAGVILMGLAGFGAPRAIDYLTTRNLDDAIYKLADGASWDTQLVAEITTLSGVSRAVADQHNARLVVTFNRNAIDLGHSGFELETVLRDDYHIAVEAADPLNIILNVTFGDTRDDMRKLVAAFSDYAARFGEGSPLVSADSRRALLRLPAFTRQVLTPRDAFFAPSTPLPLNRCAGHVSAEMVTPYPPGIPVLGPGEEISGEIVAYLTEAAAGKLRVHGPEDLSLRTLRVID